MIICYQAEAHAADRWDLQENHDEDVCYKTPKNLEERVSLAQTLTKKYDLSDPILVDEMSNDLMTKFSAWPERLYIIKDGKIVFKGGPGPFWYCLADIDRYFSKTQ